MRSTSAASLCAAVLNALDYAESALSHQVSSGLVADGRHLAKRGREEAQSFRDQYGTPMTLKVSVTDFDSVISLSG